MTILLKRLIFVGVLAALLVPSLITRFSGDRIFLASMTAFFVGILLAAFTQGKGSYWALTFPSLVVAIFGPGTITPRSVFDSWVTLHIDNQI